MSSIRFGPPLIRAYFKHVQALGRSAAILMMAGNNGEK